MKKRIFFLVMMMSSLALAEIKVKKVSADLSEKYLDDSVWTTAEAPEKLSMMGQPMVVPKSKETWTSQVEVGAVHDGKWIAFKLKWKDPEISEGGKLAKFSDAVAIEFPIKKNEAPPPIMMGGIDDPAHIFHWKYEFQLDSENGMKTVDKIYPNMTTDMYAMDYKHTESFNKATQEQKDSFIGGKAAGNPQSYPKKAVDEIIAEGFGTSAVLESQKAKGKGFWKDGEWTVIISRPLQYENGSKLPVGGVSNIGVAVWQGGKLEVGARKSLTMMWTPLKVVE